MAAPDVHIETVAPRLIAAVRERTSFPTLAQSIRAGLDKVWPQIIDRSGRNVVIYHPSEPTGLGRQFEIETGVEVPEGFVPKAPAYLRHTPGGRVVTGAHIGSYDRMRTTYEAVEAHVRQHGLKLRGASWEVYGHWNEDTSKLRTDIFYPIA